MQRILREEGLALADPLQPQRLQRLVHRYSPPSIGNLFATPRPGNSDSLEWWTELPGQSHHFKELPLSDQQKLKERLDQRLLALSNLITELEKRDNAAASELRQLPSGPSTENLYSVNGEPLLVHWVPVQSMAGPVTSSTPINQPVMARPADPPRRRYHLLLPLLLLPLMVGLILLGLWLAFNRWGPFSLPWQPSEDETIPLVCYSDNTPPPEFVAIFDTSGSMNLNIQTSREDELWFFNMPDALREFQINDPRMQQIIASPSRLTVAQGAFTDLVQAIDPSVDIGLITYQGCDATVMQGMFSAEQRPQLIKGVNRLLANDGTPLGASLLQAANIVDGKERDAVILAFVDGDDGCGQDQCAIAQEIARQQPRLKINVVDISNSGLSNCIAEQTGGRVFGSQDAEIISTMLLDAGREALGEEYCAPLSLSL